MKAQRRTASRRRKWQVLVGLAPAWAALVALPGGGCGRKSEPTLQEMPTATEVEAPLPEGDYRAEALDGLAASLDAKVAQLPGRDPAQQRERMHAVLGDVVQVLPILEGPEPSSAFRQHLRTVEAARARLNPEAGDVAAVDPAVETGLRATYTALLSIGRDEPYAGQTMAGILQQLGTAVDELDSVPGAGRPYAAADVARHVAATVRHMADVVGGRATDAPTTGPIEAPTILPGAVDAPRGAPATAPTETTEEAPSEEAPAEEAPAEEAPAEEAPAEETPAEETPAEEMPAEEAPAEEAPAEEAPAEESTEPAAEGDEPETPAEEPAEEMPAEEEGSDATPATKEAAPAEDAPAEDAPAEDAPAEDAPAEDAPAGDDAAAEGDAGAGKDAAEDEDMNK